MILNLVGVALPRMIVMIDRSAAGDSVRLRCRFIFMITCQFC